MTERNDKVRVWDLPTRIFHGLLILCVIGSYVTAETGAIEWHQRFGITMLSLLTFRLIWGFIGSTSARFVHFLYGPVTAYRYLEGWLAGSSKKYTGHNPLGGWVVLLMLLLLAMQAGMGLFANDDLYFDGPLVWMVSKETSDSITELHELNFLVLLAVIMLHVVAALLYWRLRKDNLIWPMVTGNKSRTEVEDAAALRFRSPSLALIIVAIAASAWWMVLFR
jgi:cytochrome b